MMKKYSYEFGKKEKVLNYACQTYQLTRPKRVGAVMALIRECQPETILEWEQYYFENAYELSKDKNKITKASLEELGEILYKKIKTIVIPEWQEAFNSLTSQDCVDYIYNLTINRTYDGYNREKSVIHDGLAVLFPDVAFQESDPELDHALDIDYIGKIKNDAFGVQIKPITAQFSFANYKPSERMKKCFDEFNREFGGNVFIIFSINGEIANVDVIKEIKNEINRLINKK